MMFVCLCWNHGSHEIFYIFGAELCILNPYFMYVVLFMPKIHLESRFNNQTWMSVTAAIDYLNYISSVYHTHTQITRSQLYCWLEKGFREIRQTTPLYIYTSQICKVSGFAMKLYSRLSSILTVSTSSAILYLLRKCQLKKL